MTSDKGCNKKKGEGINYMSGIKTHRIIVAVTVTEIIRTIDYFLQNDSRDRHHYVMHQP